MKGTLDSQTTPSLAASELAAALRVDASPSGLVHVDRQRVAQIAAHLRAREDFRDFTPATWDDELFWNASDSPARRSQFFAVGNALNFRFWSFDDGRVRPAAGTIDGATFRGALYMWRCLRRAHERGDLPILEAEWLADLSCEDFEQIFTDDAGLNPLAVARDERIENLRDLGRHLAATWDGAFYNVVEATGGSLVEFAKLSRSFRAFDDPVYKLTMVNAIVHSGSGTYEFRDHPLPAIDYHLLKQAIRQGMVLPAKKLSAKLANGSLLDPFESLELRRTVLAAFVQLSGESGIRGDVLDNKYWLNRTVCTDPEPDCESCPFLGPCVQRIAAQMPVEMTRYY